MSDALTGTAESGIDTAAYDLTMYKALRQKLHYDACADVRSTKTSHRGSTVTFTKEDDMAVSTTALNEYADKDAVALSDTPVVLTLAEYGNVAGTTAKIRGTGFLEYDPSAAERIGWNGGKTLDKLAQNALEATTNVYAPGAVSLNGARIREAHRQLQAANVEPWEDGFYRAFIDTNVAFDVKAETGETGWRLPQVYLGPEHNGIMKGEIGAFEGFRFMVTNGITYNADSSSKLYRNLFLGREGLAKGYSSAPGFGEQPQFVVSPQTDNLRRFNKVGWKWLGGYKVFRNEAVLRVDVKSSITP